MNRYLLLILLTSWSLVVTEGCDTGVAFANSSLSVGRSSLANADVALLETYTAPSVVKCMEDCCAGKFGDCTIASFKKNSTKKNCLHFNCRPLKQCKFVSSPTTDSFTFSSNPHALHPVPSSQVPTSSPSTTPKAKSQFEQPHAEEEIATFSEERPDLKNDNTSIKPRKGVIVINPDEILPKSGVKPRKGVTFDDIPHSKFLLNSLNKSNVKPRKGVGNYSSTTASIYQDNSVSNVSKDEPTSNELASELEKMFEDDSNANVSTTTQAVTSSSVFTILPTYVSDIYTSISIDPIIINEASFSSSSTNLPVSTDRLLEASFTSASSLSSSFAFEPTTQMAAVMTVYSTPMVSKVPLLSAREHLTMEEPKSMDISLVQDSQESENLKKYKSSMHLVLSLVFGLLVLFAVLGIVAKRMYDGWQRRDYHRMNYLIDGIYNGYE